MKIYITHHGQVNKDSLTDLGNQQAARLGEYLKHIEFSGEIYCSPCKPTMETARVISSFTNSEIVCWDMMNNQEKLKEEFEKLSLSQDTLFVGFAETHKVLADVLGIKTVEKACNCSLSVKDFSGIKRPVYADSSHLPYKMRGFNMQMQSKIDAQRTQDYIKQDQPLFEQISKETGTKLLHISDTSSFVYPYIKKMIEVIKPDVIIHTGDFADEVKAGRMINIRDEYESGVKEICGILTSSSAKEIYAVCGNNDIFEIVQKYLPDAKVLMPGSIVDICGIDSLLVHGPTQVIDEAEWAFYGHGLTGETWSPDKNNVKSGKCRFNAIWNLSVIILPERKHYVIKHPEYRE